VLAGAQYNLGLSYQYGRGVPLDYVEAYRWFDLAAAASPPGAARDNAVKHRDAVAAKMTPDQIAQAKKPIREVSPYCMKAKADFDLMLPLMIAAMRPTVQDRTVIAWGTLISSLEEHTDVDWRERCFSEILQAESISVGPGYEVVRRQANLNGDDEQRDEQPLTPKSAPTGTTIVGSGFIVNADGYVLTNHRVVADCKNVVVIVPGKAGQYAKVISFSADSDLALLQVNQRTSDFATFRGGGQIKQGEEVVLIGYPLRGSPSSRTIVTSGVISAVESIRGDGRYLQITAPVQPGNSGGPILDLSGNVVAVVIGPTKPSSASTDSKIPKNVNLAIKQSIALKLLQDANVGYTTAPSRKRMSVAAVAEQAGLFTVGVGCAE
jgi:S1-C subfamily serine protease